MAKKTKQPPQYVSPEWNGPSQTSKVGEAAIRQILIRTGELPDIGMILIPPELFSNALAHVRVMRHADTLRGTIEHAIHVKHQEYMEEESMLDRLKKGLVRYCSPEFNPQIDASFIWLTESIYFHSLFNMEMEDLSKQWARNWRDVELYRTLRNLSDEDIVLSKPTKGRPKVAAVLFANKYSRLRVFAYHKLKYGQQQSRNSITSSMSSRFDNIYSGRDLEQVLQMRTAGMKTLDMIGGHRVGILK